jgi:hypothetical protein
MAIARSATAPGIIGTCAPMDKTLRKFTNHEKARAETYRYWRSRPVAEVWDAIAEMSEQAWNAWYEMKGITPNVERSDRSLTRIQHGPR